MDAKTIEFRLLTKDSAIGTISIKRCADKLLMLKDKYSKKDESDNKEYYLALDSFIRELLLFKLDVEKSCKSSNVMKLQMEEYEKLEAKIESEIASTKDNLVRLQKQLEEEIEIREHRIECENIAASVNKYPSRSVLKRKIDQLESNLQKTDEFLKNISIEISNRKTEFGNLLTSITELQKRHIMADDENVDDANDGDDDDRHGNVRGGVRNYNDSNPTTEENENTNEDGEEFIESKENTNEEENNMEIETN